MKLNNLMVICGPTAVGKTSLALHLAKKFKGELVSADSRQVYKGMDIGTGKDRPQGSKWHHAEFPISNFQFPIGFWETDSGTRIWGYDIVDPKEEFSVAQYIKIARRIIKDIWKRGKLPLLVGGTGLYIKGVVEGIPTAAIPKNEELRKRLQSKKTSELFNKLLKLDPQKAASMNASDRKNPRRLIRAIEIAQSNILPRSPTSHFRHHASSLFIGLTAPRKILNQRIEKRAKRRLEKGLIDEIQTLLGKDLDWNDQSMQTLGYKEWKNYFLGELTKKEAIIQWIRNERQYAKRQIIWFKRNKNIHWFDVTSKNYSKNVEKLVSKWHNKSNSA